MRRIVAAGIALLLVLFWLWGYLCAIHSAELTAHTEHGYEITFHGQTYFYEYENN